MFKTNDRKLQRMLLQHRLRSLLFPPPPPQGDGRKGSVELGDPRAVAIMLDPMGRAMNRETGEYLKKVDEPAPPGMAVIKQGVDEGIFLTLDEDGDLVPWMPPDDYVLN